MKRMERVLTTSGVSQIVRFILLSALTGCRSKPMTVHNTEPLSLNPMAGILKGPYEIQDESGKPIGVKMWTEGETKKIEKQGK